MSAPVAHLEGDDAVTVDQAIKALGVSRRTIWRMIDRGELVRATDATGPGKAATVTKRSLVEALELRPKDSGGDTGAAQSAVVAEMARDTVRAEREAAEARTKIALLEERAGRLEATERERDELRESDQEHKELLTRMTVGSWSERRKARKEARKLIGSKSEPS